MVEKGNEAEEPVGEAEELLPELEEEEPEEPPVEEEVPELPVFMREEEPTGKEDKAKYWILKEPALSDDEIASSKNINVNTVRIARSHLARDKFIKKERKPSGGKQKETPGTALAPRGQEKGMQIFAKGSPPEAIIESLHVPIVDGQAEGLEKGMKFGMSLIVLAVRLMQELSDVSLKQVQPLIALTRSVREGEQAAFKGGAEEGALKAAQAMGNTILPMFSEIQAGIASAARGSEADPMKSMLVRTMEPLMKNLLGKVVPGMKDEPPSGWTRKQE